MAIQAGVSPRVVEELLKSHIPPSERDKPAPEPGGRRAAAAKPRPPRSGGSRCRTEATTRSTRSTKST